MPEKTNQNRPEFCELTFSEDEINAEEEGANTYFLLIAEVQYRRKFKLEIIRRLEQLFCKPKHAFVRCVYHPEEDAPTDLKSVRARFIEHLAQEKDCWMLESFHLRRCSLEKT